MRPNGTIYKGGRQASAGEVKIALSKKEKRRIKILHWMGANMASFGIAAVLFFYGPTFLVDLDYVTNYARLRSVRAQNTSDESNNSIVKIATAKEENAVYVPIVSPTPEPTEKPVKQQPIVEEFSISIPAIGATSDVIEDVNPYSKDEYLAALQRGVAHAGNTKKPGEGGRVYLFAHSTNSPLNFNQYNAVFYQLRLLEKGDLVIANYNGNEHKYRVKQMEIVEASDTHWLTENKAEEDLVLQTCDPPGTTLRRLLVIATPV